MYRFAAAGARVSKTFCPVGVDLRGFTRGSATGGLSAARAGSQVPTKTAQPEGPPPPGKLAVPTKSPTGVEIMVRTPPW